MADQTQKLTVESVAKGFEQSAKEIGKISDGFDETLSAAKRMTEGIDSATAGIDKIASAKARLQEQTKRLVSTIREEIRDHEKLRQRLVGVAKGTAGVVLSVIKLALVMRVLKRAYAALPAAAAIVRGGWAIVSVIKAEVAERLRLIDVMRTQADVANELLQRQQDLKATVEAVAGRRRVGGFGADTARLVAGGAERAGLKFTQLPPEAIAQAFGTFGDIGGMSQRDLTDLAIIAGFGGLGELDVQGSREDLSRQARELLDRFRKSGRIATFAERETRQGQGLGRGEFRHGPTEKAQRIVGEARAPAGTDAELRERLRELLPPEVDIDQAVALIKLFGTPGVFEAAKVGVNSSRGATALNNLSRLVPLLEISLPDQPGFGNQGLEALGLGNEFLELPVTEYNDLVRAFRQIFKEGSPGANVTINTYNLQNAKIVGPDSFSQRRAIRNGQNHARRAERLFY